jgi:ABC-type xylose transport system permease subunit
MSRLFISALLASVAAGIPDVFVAAALSRAPPGRILQTIASGVLGEASYKGGSTSMALV